MSYTGPDPRENSTTAYRAKMYMTIEVSTYITTSNYDSQDAGDDEQNALLAALEAIGFECNITKYEIERA